MLLEIRGLLGCQDLLIEWSDEDGKYIPQTYKTTQIHQNHVNMALLIECSLRLAFKLVALDACGVIFGS
jgi:hypothetical protein